MKHKLEGIEYCEKSKIFSHCCQRIFHANLIFPCDVFSPPAIAQSMASNSSVSSCSESAVNSCPAGECCRCCRVLSSPSADTGFSTK